MGIRPACFALAFAVFFSRGPASYASPREALPLGFAVAAGLPIYAPGLPEKLGGSYRASLDLSVEFAGEGAGPARGAALVGLGALLSGARGDSAIVSATGAYISGGYALAIAASEGGGLRLRILPTMSAGAVLLELSAEGEDLLRAPALLLWPRIAVDLGLFAGAGIGLELGYEMLMAEELALKALCAGLRLSYRL